jgi:hypothetical protein
MQATGPLWKKRSRTSAGKIIFSIDRIFITKKSKRRFAETLRATENPKRGGKTERDAD